MSESPACCICGDADGTVGWCDECGHAFCAYHRWALWGRVERSIVAVKAMVFGIRLRHCTHE